MAAFDRFRQSIADRTMNASPQQRGSNTMGLFLHSLGTATTYLVSLSHVVISLAGDWGWQ
ncbi:hypothetical protein [Actinoplanes sp. N902-109]|uniref:hypothetical protein n=1 Tax=Actinoplanes sp. (strain N902-109) TaxID=649831 RepID=UPI0003294316|nr:hypothetical protein [Actinoplanes sp. N902-109]AGL13774.1 hypothetical protein L083_0264 [Actinoplanes sp. N902-109]